MLKFLNDYITGDRLKSCAKVVYSHHNESMKKPVKAADIIWCKTDFIGEVFDWCRDKEKRWTIITHNSDFPITEHVFESRPKSLIKWYGVNVEYSHESLIPVPLGCENLRSPGYSGDMSILDGLSRKKADKRILVLLNFNPSTHRERGPLMDFFSRLDWVTSLKYGADFKKTMSLTRDSKFVICPRGNGADTHRVAESVYLGAIPVVKRNRMYEEFSKSTPMVIVDEWLEVTPDRLDKEYRQLNAQKWTYDHFKIGYWQRRVRDTTGKHRNF